MDIPSKYDPGKTEGKWYGYWLGNGFFSSVPDKREPYTVVIPPPNVTGVLHMGHMLNNTIQDILVRRARMTGRNALWVPGTDHASIATEARVVAKLKNEGVNKHDLSREEFLSHAWEWKHKHGGIILEQLKKLGASCDWDRTVFTMDEGYSESVADVFIQLYRKGYIYRGVRMVNWDPQAKTALSDEEVNYREVGSKLYHVRYDVKGSDEGIVIATTRPETILGDTAVCVNPADERYRNLKDAGVVIPVVNREVRIIEDNYVDMEFGTGALKITPAHDINDYEIGLRHNLEVIDIFNDDGTLSEKAGVFVGMDRFEARGAVIKRLEEEGRLLKVEDHVNNIGFSERTDAVIEPKLSMQWFCSMKEMAAPALENVMNDSINLHPKKFKNVYRHWMENVKDWCISRQLWWGHRIPAWYLPDSNEFVVAKTAEEALPEAVEKSGNSNLKASDLRQDEDVMDTWFSSWLWPIAVFDGIRNPSNHGYKYYYPTNDLVTAPEILFFWVARMIMAGYEFAGERPFRNVYLTGIVRDNKGRKMSKSLGNSPEPLELIKKYGADGVRVGMMLCSPAGGDLLFDESLTGQGRNFANKIWNAFRLVKSWKASGNVKQKPQNRIAVEWFESVLNRSVVEINKNYESFRLSEVLMILYRLFWEDFSSWYLEIIKPSHKEPIDNETLDATITFFDRLTRLLHPFMPFITEEIWQLLEERKKRESIMVSEMPAAGKVDKKLLRRFSFTKEIVTAVRSIRAERNIPQRKAIKLLAGISEEEYNEIPCEVISGLCNLSEISRVSGKPQGALSFMVQTTEFFIPVEENIDLTEEIIKVEKELSYTKGFLESVMKKLGNERFVNNAPERVVKQENRKKEDALSKIRLLEGRLSELKGNF